MKVVYNSKEIINNTNNYNSLLNRPMMNSKTLEGAITLNDVNAYSKQQIDELIGQSRSIEIVTTLPVNLIENTLYYVGPDANDFYTVYLVDEVRNVFEIGTSQFGEYFAGTGINIDSDNYVTTKIDNKTIVVDSDNNLHANLDVDSVPVMVGATASADGEKGLVPAPAIGDQNKFLLGNATWKSFIDIVYPVGSGYITYDNSTNPNNIFPGTTWTRLANGTLWTSTATGTALDAQLPAIVGTFKVYPDNSADPTGVFTRTTENTGYGWALGGVAWSGNHGTNNQSFDAANGTYDTSGNKMSSADSPYGKSNTVQIKTIAICAWRRTA